MMHLTPEMGQMMGYTRGSNLKPRAHLKPGTAPELSHTQMGYNYLDYRTQIIIIPAPNTCGFAGLGDMGCMNTCTTFLQDGAASNPNDLIMTAAHEVRHMHGSRVHLLYAYKVRFMHVPHRAQNICVALVAHSQGPRHVPRSHGQG